MLICLAMATKVLLSKKKKLKKVAMICEFVLLLVLTNTHKKEKRDD